MTENERRAVAWEICRSMTRAQLDGLRGEVGSYNDIIDRVLHEKIYFEIKALKDQGASWWRIQKTLRISVVWLKTFYAQEGYRQKKFRERGYYS